MFVVNRLNTYITLSDRRTMLSVALLNRNFTTAEILLRNIRIKNQIITVVKMMTKLMFVRKASNTIYTRFNTGSESKDSSARMGVVNQRRQPKGI